MGLFDTLMTTDTPQTPAPADGAQQTGGNPGGQGDDSTTPVSSTQESAPSIIITDDTPITSETPSILSLSSSDDNISISDITPGEASSPIMMNEASTPVVLPETPILTPVIESSPLEQTPTGVTEDTQDPEILDKKIASFIEELNALRSNEEILLHGKEAAIENLENQIKTLKAEVKQIKTDEAKIDTTIASLQGNGKSK